MARKSKFNVAFSRKRQGKTDYKKRLKQLLSGKTRLVIRKSNKNMVIQAVSYEKNGDKILVNIHSNSLETFGWKYAGSSIPAAYLTGYLAGKEIIKKGIKEAVPDIGLQAKGDRLFAALKGAADAGLAIPYDNKVVPDEKRLSGAHIGEFAEKLAQDKEKYKKQFSGYAKAGIDPKDIKNTFEQVKEKIDKK